MMQNICGCSDVEKVIKKKDVNVKSEIWVEE